MADNLTELLNTLQGHITEMRNLLNGEDGEPSCDNITNASKLVNLSITTLTELHKRLADRREQAMLEEREKMGFCPWKFSMFGPFRRDL